MKPLSLKKSALLSSAVFIFFAALFVFTEKRGGGYIAAKIAYSAFPAAITFLIFYTGKISKYRSIFFITSAAAFIIVFKFKLWGLTKNIIIAPRENVPEVPFCHIAIASNFLVAFLDQAKAVFFYNWTEWGFYSFGVLYIFATLGIGQAFCSWGCFYGGIDEGFSKVLKKKTVKINNVPRRLRDFPLGFWIFLMLASLVLVEPVFCLWFCPLKLTTALLNDGAKLVYKMQIIVFVTIGILFLFVFPLLIKKRTFCSFICPFGAFISVAGRVNPYRVVIDKEKCAKCGDCIDSCPMMAITPERKVLPYCVKCGKCIDVCGNNAIKLGIRNSEFGTENTEIFFILSCVVFGGMISSFFIPEAVIVIFKIAGI